VEVAAEYLVMAAHLVYLKSRELVPSPEPLETVDDEEEVLDPREELIRRLLEYQKYKNASRAAGSRPNRGPHGVQARCSAGGRRRRPGYAEHSVWKLIEQWAQVLSKAEPQHTHDVVNRSHLHHRSH